MTEAPASPSSEPSVRPTSYDVAKRAGVSQSAVSRCFRPGSSISKKTKAKVLKAARELGYFPNAMASGLMTRRTGMVAVIISSLTNLYYPEVLAEITQRLSDKGARVLLFALRAESEVGEILEQVWRYRVDGAIVAAHLSPEQIRQFVRHEVPVVLYNRSGGDEPVSSVSCDSFGGEKLLVDKMVKAGHRSFGILSGPPDSFVGCERVQAAIDSLAAHSLNAAVASGNFDYASGRSGLAQLIEDAGGQLDAVLCANDLMAIGALDEARARAITVPDNLSIVGFDGVAPASWESYRLTTIRQPVRRMSAAAVEMILARIADPSCPPEARNFAGSLIEGASARLA
ncbi:LacI family DNA-binding transcriptional regulator [Erythrobacter sp.]|jgi:DNA-binding LacI/PurR family transcriptional regulator|uniref:LacI family DNA-binding transcriptional regulator n=1 Tax=Erythrobacter sp. TaxID=1042 RepID=UPI002EB0D86D|nr:LacI family DNA-binding transcriptional regulator [Erythrobacter sp.]